MYLHDTSIVISVHVSPHALNSQTMQSSQTAVVVQAQVTEGCVVEVIAHTDHVQYIISNPQEASDKAGSHQHDGVAAPGSNTFLLHPSRWAALNHL